MTGPVKRALVTGGSDGLGASIVRWLVSQDYDVVVLDIEKPGFAEKPVEFVRCDLSDRTHLEDILPKLVEAGPYDLVVLNAGINATGRFEAIETDLHLDVMRINLEAPMIISARLLAAGAFTPKAAMVLVSSLSLFIGYPGAASYAASKDALAVYAKSMRKIALAKHVSITVAFPGPLRTSHAERHSPEGANAEKRMDPDIAAGLIMADTLAGRRQSIPGFGNRLSALAGRLFPRSVTAVMRRVIYQRLKP